ncbi:MAG: ParB/RepB/Spo0J family partition protein [Candidatus Aminicenantes bacterium]|nr:ParB/RepB/Spo0J family partition protein [Candidatus Aminicenantes bacterium]
MKKQALGKGLKAFLSEEYGILKEDRYAELEIEKLRPNPHQPRKTFDPTTLAELGQSIQETGILQPIVVVPDEDHFTIIVGERRWRAAQKIGLRTVPAIIRQMTEEQQLEAALVENLQREDLNPLEIATAYQKMTQDLHLTQEQVAIKVGKDRASVSNYVRLLKLPQRIQNMLTEDKLSMGHARALLSIENPALQVQTALEINKRDLSVRAVENLIKNLTKKPDNKIEHEPNPDLLALQEEFLKIFGTKVSISGNLKKGVVKIFYYSPGELERIYEKAKGGHS